MFVNFIFFFIVVFFFFKQKTAYDMRISDWSSDVCSSDLLEDLQSQHPNRAAFPDAYFFVPEYTLLIGQFNVEIKGRDPQRIVDQIHATRPVEEPPGFEGRLKYRMNKSAYLTAFADLQRHIRQGDAYEVNLCQEFYAEKRSEEHTSELQSLMRISYAVFCLKKKTKKSKKNT